MELPKHEVTFEAAASNRAITTESGTAFMVGVTTQGPHEEARLVRSLSEFRRLYGDPHATLPTFYYSVEYAFQKGLRRAWIGRQVGPAPVRASVAVVDGSAGTVFTVEALHVGAYANDWTLEVRTTAEDAAIPAGSFRLRLRTDAGALISESGDLADKAAAVAYLADHPRLRIKTDGASALDPAAGSLALAGGTDDAANITNAELVSALALFDSEKGMGQVAAPGQTSATAHDAVQDHAERFARVPLLDPPDGTAADVEASLALAMAHPYSHRSGAFAPWGVVRGASRSSLRRIPPSAYMLGYIAASDGENPINTAVGGAVRGNLDLVDLATRYTLEEQQAVYAAGGNPVALQNGDFVVQGFRSLAKPDDEDTWGQLNHARTAMLVQYVGDRIASSFKLERIDGRGSLFGRLNSALVGFLLPLYRDDSLFGETPDDAFTVDTDSPNDLDTIGAGEVNALVDVTFSKHAERVRITISKRAISEG